ncbi:MAG: ATP synthase F1 subunit epsilon [Flavobacteriales bacterium TMED191]|nr:MAG: ATP synthase F1 subunit epsilon [Flavobacteriales bacterium TMED191]|tara:strand:+ start:483 stop:725 length:243 start_codon:yes stop_codon:yes gene_type:complete
MNIEILTLEKKILSIEAKSVIVPGKNGKFEMLNNHAPIISILDKGTIKVTDINKKEQFVDILGGSIEMFNNKITILAETE